MKDTDIASDWIDRYNEGELDPADRKFFEQQMALNRLLRAEVALDAQLNRLLQDRDLLELMERVASVTGKHRSGANRWGYIMVAATLFSLVTVGIFSYFNQSGMVAPPVAGKHQPGKPLTTKGRSPAIPASDSQWRQERENQPGSRTGESTTMQLAANYRPMAELESLVGSVTRSSLVNVTAPRSETSLSAGQRLKFTWTKENAEIPVTVVVMNNHGKTVVESQGLKADSVVIQTKGMPAGLYYWKVTVYDELVVLGRMILK